MGSSSSSSSSNYSSNSNVTESKSIFVTDQFYNCERNQATQNAAWRNVIKIKINQEIEKHNSNLESEIKNLYSLDLNTFVTALGDTEMFKKTFLNPILSSKNILAEIDEEMEQIEGLTDGLTSKELEKAINRMNERKSKILESQIKFLLTTTNISTSFIVRKLAKIANFEFGTLHTALSLNGVVIEWGRGLCGASLVCPTLDLSGLLFSLNVVNPTIWSQIKDFFLFAFRNLLNALTFGWGGSFLIGVLIDDQINEVAKICTRYNREENYNFMHSNCQTFVLEVCKSANVDLKFEGELRIVMEEIVSSGKCNFKFKDNHFEKRSQLDDYVMRNNFQKLCPDDRKLLFVFKNIFDSYLKHDPNNDKFKTTSEANSHWKSLLLKFNFD